MSDLFKKPNISKYDKNDPRALPICESTSIDPNQKFITYKNKRIFSRKLLYAKILQILFEKEKNSNGIDVSHLEAGEAELYQLLRALLNHFMELSKKDRSNDILFINGISNTWCNLILSINRRRSQKHPHEYLGNLNKVIDSIESYGSLEGKSFGYYLYNHKGQNTDWFPIPYLEMISRIYEDYLVDKDKSFLSLWSHDLLALMIEISTKK